MKLVVLATAALLLSAQARAADLQVGPDKQYKTVCSAVSAHHPGDRILVDTGWYFDDTCQVNNGPLALVAVGGVVNLQATKNIPNGKGIFVTNGDITITGFGFSGARVVDGNGAGIRHESGNLVVEGWGYFVANQNGILTGSSGTLTLRNGIIFRANGTGDGFTHNFYANKLSKVTLDYVCSLQANVGHEFKSRAAVNEISNSYFETKSAEADGTGSYQLDFPNGGAVTLTNVFVQQGPNTGNPKMIAYGEEGGLWATSSFSMNGFTLVNDLASSSALGVWNTTGATAQLSNGTVYGLTNAQIASGPNTKTNVQIVTTRPPASPCEVY
jgi:hypothetical protein